MLNKRLVVRFSQANSSQVRSIKNEVNSVMDWKYHHYISQLQRTTKKVHENFVVSSLFHDSRLSELLPLTQYYVRRDEKRYALVDLYYPQLHIAVEIDEPHHAFNADTDRIRESEVEIRSGCKFRRIRVADDDILAQIEKLKEDLVEEKNALNALGIFEAWAEPKSATFDELKTELKRTLFVKIKGKIPENSLLRRQTGAWRLADWKRQKVEMVVVVHDGVVTRAFSDIKWLRDPSRGNKWAYHGTEVDSLESIGSVLSGWSYQATAVYSNDIEQGG